MGRRKRLESAKGTGLLERRLTLHGCVHAVWQKGGTAKVNNPDARNIRTGFYENVLQLYVAVEHTPWVDPNKGIHQLFYYDLRAEMESTRLHLLTDIESNSNFCYLFATFI